MGASPITNEPNAFNEPEPPTRPSFCPELLDELLDWDDDDEPTRPINIKP